MTTRTTPLHTGAVVLILLAACTLGGEGIGHRGYDKHAARMARDAALLASSDDTVFDRRLADLRRRAAAVPIDSMVRLYLSIPSTPDSLLAGTQRAVDCETMRLLGAHGQAPFTRAHERIIDSLLLAGFAFHEHEQRMATAPGEMVEITMGGFCGAGLTALPDSLTQEVSPPQRTRARS